MTSLLKKNIIFLVQKETLNMNEMNLFKENLNNKKKIKIPNKIIIAHFNMIKAKTSIYSILKILIKLVKELKKN
jgi:hypothetical protein